MFWKNASFKKGMILGESDWIIDAQKHKKNFATHTDHFSIISGGHMSHISNTSVMLKELLHFLEKNPTSHATPKIYF